MTDSKVLEVVVVTGQSGAGKSTAVHALEDLGYFCVDNLPVPVVLATLEALRDSGQTRVALGIDVRGRAYLEEAAPSMREIGALSWVHLQVLFLDAPEELLARRFSATRRPHPLSQGAGVRAVMDGIRMERQMLTGLRDLASVVIDSAAFSVHDLRREVIKSFSMGGDAVQKLIVRVVSFGFKYGAPNDADLLFDVRFLPNPYFDEALRPFSGKDFPVSSYVLGNVDAQGFLERLMPLLLFCLPRYQAEGKSYVTIGIGCTGGRHRSVALTEEISGKLSQELGFPVDAVHRDIRQAEHITVGSDSPSSRPASR